MTSKVWLTRHVMRGWFHRRAVLQVQRRVGGEWRDATKTDLEAIEDEKEDAIQARRNNGVYPVGQRVWVNKHSGFSRGATGVVVFQEPNQGKVWVQRDGAEGPAFFYGSELEYALGSISAPHYERVVDSKDDYPYWWITVGSGRITCSEASDWCEENGIGEHVVFTNDDDGYDSWVMLAGFASETDATMFYMRFA